MAGPTDGEDFAALLDDVVATMKGVPTRGKVADYIPGLSTVDPARFGIALFLADGRSFSAGDADEGFSIQSISKVFALSIALGRVGDALWQRVGREPSGTAFNSIVQLEHERGVPRNPFVNPGALVVDDVLLGQSKAAEAIAEIMHFVRGAAGHDDIVIDKAIALAEREAGFRNVALANFIKSFDNLRRSPDELLGVCYHQCAIVLSCRQLAQAGRYLVGLGTAEDQRLLSTARARRINALMILCGLYDGAGDFAFRVGLPAKSGVGGSILAISTGDASIAVWSPGLDASGNSLIGIRALEQLTELTGWSAF